MNIVGKRLTEFIDRLVSAVRSPEFPISPRQIIDAHDVGLRLLGTGGGQVSSSTLKYSLAPIFCAVPAEQAAFYDCYDRLLETEIVAKPVTSARGLPEKLQVKADSTKSTPKIIHKWFRQRLATKVVTFALLLSAATWSILAMMPGDDSQIVPGLAGPESEVVLPKTGQNDKATNQATSLAPTELLRADQSRIISAGIWLIILIPAITGISSLARRIVGRRVFLTAHSSRSHPELRPIPVAETGKGLYENSQLLTSVATLRQPEQDPITDFLSVIEFTI